MIGARASAKSATGHGSPLPTLVRGDPGRAGGGEEMGGLRGVKHFMLRTALQGTPRLLAAVTGDTFYAHMDEEAARANPFFDGRVVHGCLIVAFAAGLFVDPAPGRCWPIAASIPCAS